MDQEELGDDICAPELVFLLALQALAKFPSPALVVSSFVTVDLKLTELKGRLRLFVEPHGWEGLCHLPSPGTPPSALLGYFRSLPTQTIEL